ncbi:unnamed protein product [Symbiodinium sp. CCMP2592]|nr:unnamed protein product [Symbiodinium sp. CCMP2592]
MSAQLSHEAAVASADQGPELLGSPDLTPAGEPAASASQAESQELVFGSLGDFDSAAPDAVLQETAHDPELVSLEELAKSLREPNAASGLHLGPAPASPAGSLGRASPVGGPPSVVLSPTFSWGAQSDAEKDPGSETRWWNQVRDSEPESGPAGVSSSSGSFDFAATFRMAVQAQWRMPEREPLKQPWEQGIFGELFGSGGPELLPTLKRSVPTILKEDGAPSGGAETAAVKRSRIVDKGVSFAAAVQIRVAVAWSEQREAQFEIGIDLWMTLMKGWSSCSFVDLLDAELPGDAQRGVISDIFRGKENLATFPCVERELYQYLKHLGCLGVVESFKESKQAPALTVAQLLLLHEALESHQDPWTRHFAGCALVATFSQGGELIYLELRIGVHKTCRLQSKRHRFLHVVSPSLGLKQFGELWLKSRRDIGLSDEKDMPFCPVPDASGRPTVRGIESDEATTWLRLLLKSEPGKEIEPSSKSFKATILSWAAKRGVDGLSIQRLGYHASGGLDFVYSRDAQAPYILLVEKLLAEVRDGRFKPDETRGGRIIGAPTSLLEPLVEPLVGPGIPGDSCPEVGAPVPQLVKEEIRSDLSAGSFVVVNATESEAEDDLVSLGSSTDSADEYEHQPVAMVAGGDAVPDGFDLWLHAGSKIAHLGVVVFLARALGEMSPVVHCSKCCTEAEVPGGYSGWESLHVFVSAEHTHLQAVGIRYRNAEATTYVIQALKDQVSADAPEGQVRKMPMAERAVQQENQVLSDRAEYLEGRLRLLHPWSPSQAHLFQLAAGVSSAIQQAPQDALPSATQAFARQRARFAALIRSDDSVRFEALRKIKTLTLLDPAASELGRLLIGEAAILSDPERLQKSFADTFATKSTATLAKRASSFWKFAEFCLMFDFGSPFRASEAAVYAYIQDLQAHGAPTSAKAFLESWNFLSALLGFAKLAGQSPLSGRVRGAAAALAATKKPLVQASPLSVPMIRALERIVVKPPYPHWRVIAGHILFCVGSCSRFSDTIHLKSLELQSAGTVHLLEASSASYKTGTGERKTILLPLLCLGSFVYPTIWAPLWMEARADAGLGLNPHIDIPSESRISSHSMKATFLSWLAKFGGVSLEDRRIAGHHLDPDSRSPLTYSRDELCRLMKIFEDILKAIRSGHFKPDDSRVMRLAVMVQAESGPQLQEKLLEQDPYVSDSEAGDSDISPEDLEARAGGVPLDNGLNAAQIPSVYSKMHIYSRTVHIQAAEGAKFLCGRPITRNFDELDKAVPAAFKARAIELNFPEETLKKLAAINVDTFGALAFIGPLQAGTTDEGPLISMLKRALGSASDDALMSIARRLWFESTTQALAEMRGKVERTDASEPVRMPLAERTQRLAALQKRLVGIHWTSDIEPSHKLQDLVAQMVSDQSLLWIPWDRLTSRALEITSDKTDQAVSFDSAGNLKLVKRSAEPSCSTIGEYAVKLALQRRSLAFELARVCRYEYLESWHDQLLQVHMRSQPSGHQRVSIAQLREADKFLWTRIAEDTRGSLSMRSDGSYPFEASLAKWKDHTQVQCYLLPLMRSPPPPPTPHTPNIPPNKDGKGGGKDKNQKGLKIRKDTPGAEKPNSAAAGVMTPSFRDDETGGKRLAAEELADQLLARPTEPVLEGALLVWGLLLFQDFTCTTIAVFTNLQTQLHQDTANDSRSHNLLYPLSKFSEGDVWIESDQGKVPFEHRGEVLWGDSLPVSQGLCYLDAPNCRHATLAWKGERSILVGYTAQGADCMPQETRTFLENLEFPLPPEGPRPISKKARLAGAPEPVPLRDNDHILGLPNLSDTDKARVRKANELCRFVVELIRALPSSTFVSIENPNNSWIWGVLAFFVQESRDPALLEKWRRMIDVRFHNCMKGGRRPKHSRFRCSDSRLSSMAVECDNQHRHDPYLVYQTGRQWRFSTAEEAEYPPQLCQEVSQLLAATAGLPSCLEPPAGPRAVWPQPRGSHKLIPEFLEFRTEAPLDRPFKEFTSGLGGGSGRFGVYRTPTEFIDCALKLSHPFDTQHCVPDAVKRNIFRRLTEGPSAFAEERLRLYNRLNQMEKELRYEEARLHSTLPDHTREVIKGKNLLLWAQLLKETKFPDEGVFDLMMGVDLVGKPDKSPLFETKESPATSTPELLLESARWRRERLKGRDPHEKDPEATWQLWDCTLKDRDDGFLTGPFYDEDEVKKHLGVEEFVCSRRFVIEQGTPERPKLRPIDNYKEGGVNEAYHSLEKLALFDVNWMTAMATYIARVSDGTGDLEIVLSTGEILRGELHSQRPAPPATPATSVPATTAEGGQAETEDPAALEFLEAELAKLQETRLEVAHEIYRRNREEYTISKAQLQDEQENERQATETEFQEFQESMEGEL